jgi:hypothetical protein
MSLTLGSPLFCDGQRERLPVVEFAATQIGRFVLFNPVRWRFRADVRIIRIGLRQSSSPPPPGRVSPAAMWDRREGPGVGRFTQIVACSIFPAFAVSSWLSDLSTDLDAQHSRRVRGRHPLDLIVVVTQIYA